MKAKPKSFAVSVRLQKVFIYSALITYGLSVIQIASWVFNQYPTNHNLSSYLLISVSTVILPTVFLLLAFLSNKQIKGLARWFEATVFMVIGTFIQGTISDIRFMSFFRWHTWGSTYWQSIASELSFMGVSLVIYTIGLWWYRKREG